MEFILDEGGLGAMADIYLDPHHGQTLKQRQERSLGNEHLGIILENMLCLFFILTRFIVEVKPG